MKFLILALPRSRTAWLANFLTYGPSFCFHEGLLGCSNIAQFKRRMEGTGTPVAGNSDCGNVFFIDRMMEIMDAQIVIVRRDLQEVIASLDRIGEPFAENETVKAADKILDEIPRRYSCLQIGYNDLNEHGCKLIWEHCTGTEFNRDRWEMLDGMRINIDINRKAANISANETNINKLIMETF